MDPTTKNETRGRGRPKGTFGAHLPRDVRRKKAFAIAIDRHASKTIGELKTLLADIEDKTVIEIMAIRTLLRAAEDGSAQSISLILAAGSNIKKATPPKGSEAPPAAPDFVDPTEFDAQ